MTELQGRYLVAVIGPDNRVSVHGVQVGDRVGGMWIASSGLEAGERVVSEGTAKVRDGSMVTPKPDQAGDKALE